MGRDVAISGADTQRLRRFPRYSRCKPAPVEVTDPNSGTDFCSTVETTTLDSPIPNDAFFRALSFLLEYEQSRDTVHLEAALKEYRVLLERTPVENADYLAFQSFLCDALCEQFDLWGNVAVIEEAVALGDAIISMSSPAPPDYLHHLCCSASSLALRYDSTTEESDVMRAVELVEVARAGAERRRSPECRGETPVERHFHNLIVENVR